jgi:DNA-binding HxlR family transcriptional regulator
MPEQLAIYATTVPSTKILADVWTMRIVHALLHGGMRFSQLRRSLGIGSKTLAKKLKELEHEALVTRTLYAQMPLRVDYELTAKGHEFAELIGALARWEAKWR